MPTKKQEPQRNFLEEYIALAKDRCDKARHKQFCRLMCEYFENMAVVTIMIADRVQVACFIEEDLNSYWPVFTYWLTREQRIPIIARMYKQGMSGTKIAQFLKLAPATIYRDLGYIRNVQPFKIDNRTSLRAGDLRASRIIHDGDFKLAALNFEAQKLDMKRAFVEAKGQTLQ
jgi:hypothetical protein